MLAELSEAKASGEIADIFAVVRRLFAVPYVSAIYRHLATTPGLLEWAWGTVAPAFRDGSAQETSWRLAADLPVAPLAPISREALHVLGVDASAEAAVRATCEGFVRVAPANMMFAALLKMLLAGDKPKADGTKASTWSPPQPLPAPPKLVDMATLDEALRAVLMRFAATAADGPFVPGLYRMLGHWPGLMARLSVVLAPRNAAAETHAAYDLLRARIDAAVPDIFARLPASAAAPAMPSGLDRARVLDALATYRKTSPEMVVFGRLIRDALPSTV